MAYVIDMPPVILQQVAEYERATGRSFEPFAIDAIQAELRRQMAMPRRRKLGGLRGQVWVAPDFDETDAELVELFENSSI